MTKTRKRPTQGEVVDAVLATAKQEIVQELRSGALAPVDSLAALDEVRVSYEYGLEVYADEFGISVWDEAFDDAFAEVAIRLDEWLKSGALYMDEVA